MNKLTRSKRLHSALGLDDYSRTNEDMLLALIHVLLVNKVISKTDADHIFSVGLRRA